MKRSMVENWTAALKSADEQGQEAQEGRSR
jgi:hypothetical protein